jgi:hypothetical protein
MLHLKQGTASGLHEAKQIRGGDIQQGGMYSYLSPEERIPAEHPLRAVRALLDEALSNISREFDHVYSEGGRASIRPERMV